MESYPSIDRKIVAKPIYAFDKKDGSNLRVEWVRKNGFWKWGTKTQLLDASNPDFGDGIGLFEAKYASALDGIFRKQQLDKTTVFFEYWSPNTFAGLHAKEPHDVTLIDLKVYKRGFLLPKDYLKMVGHLDIARLLYYGNPNADFVASVQEGRLENMSFEGVVCKGEYIHPGTPLMFKIKNRAWIEKLRQRCNGDEKMFVQLS